jgi:hypothetical protein
MNKVLLNFWLASAAFDASAVLAAVSEQGYVAIVNTVVGAIVTVFGLYIGFKAKSIEKTVVDTKKWVNSMYGVQLRRIAVTDRRLAIITKNTADELVADESERVYAEHMAKGRAIDRANASRGNNDAVKEAVKEIRKEATEAVAEKLKQQGAPG